MEIYVQNIFGACKKIIYEHWNTVSHPGNNLIWLVICSRHIGHFDNWDPQSLHVCKIFFYSHHIDRVRWEFFKKNNDLLRRDYHVSTPKGHVLFIGQTYSACLHFMRKGFRVVLWRVKCVYDNHAIYIRLIIFSSSNLATKF